MVAAAGLISYVVQVMLSVKTCLMDRIAVLLGKRSPQVSILGRLIDQQVRLLKLRCCGYTKTRECFQAWRAAREGHFAKSRALQLRESQLKISRLQLESKALTMRLMQLMHERDHVFDTRLQHRCLVKWHQFAIAKHMLHATERHLHSKTEEQCRHIAQRHQLCANAVQHWIRHQADLRAHALLHAWSNAVALKCLYSACEDWRAEAATFRSLSERYHSMCPKIIERSVDAMERLRCKRVVAFCLYEWQQYLTSAVVQSELLFWWIV
jgi:hypothetical protein